MYMTPNVPERIYLELQPATRIDVEQYDDIVWEAATETVAAQRVGQENIQQDRSLRGQLPHKAENNGARENFWGGRQHQLLKFAAVVVTFLIAVTALVIVVIKWSESTNPEKGTFKT